MNVTVDLGDRSYDVVLENPQLRKTIRRKVTVEAGKPTFLKVDLTQG